MTNSKTTKKALYSSVLAVILCVAMLVGTTFAWFTDTASTSVNKIQAGKLDVALEMLETNADGTTTWVTAEGKTLNFKAVDNRTEILWESGCTYELPKLRIVNKGDLALKYTVKITGINGDAKLNEAIEWDMAGTEDGQLLPEANKEFTIKGHMSEEAGNEYQGLSIEGVAITVYATQATSESDSYDNQYDKDASYINAWSGESAPLERDDNTPATVKTLSDVTDTEAKTVKIDSPELLAAFAKSVNAGNSYTKYNVTLEEDINLGNKAWTPIGTSENGFEGTFDGQNHVISNLKFTSGSNVGLFGHITLGPRNYTPGIKNLEMNNVTIKADNSGAFVGSAHTTTYNAGNGGALILTNLKLTGNVAIEGENVGGIVGIGWTDFQIAATDITVDAKSGSYVKGTGVIGGVFASTPHGSVSNIKSNIAVIASGAEAVAGGIVGSAGWTLTDVTCTGNVTATGVAATENGKYKIGKIVGQEANNSYWNVYRPDSSRPKAGSEFANFTANNTIKITLTNGTVLTENGLTSADKRGTDNLIDYNQSMVGAAIWDWLW